MDELQLVPGAADDHVRRPDAPGGPHGDAERDYGRHTMGADWELGLFSLNNI